LGYSYPMCYVLYSGLIEERKNLSSMYKELETTLQENVLLEDLMDSPIGIRHNNPGNIIKSPNYKWLGETACDGQFACFVRPEYGIRAMVYNLRSYHHKHGINTVRGVIERWSTTDVEPYISFVSNQLSVDPDDVFTLDNNPIFTAALVSSMIHFENGKQPYNEDMIFGIAVYQDWID